MTGRTTSEFEEALAARQTGDRLGLGYVLCHSGEFLRVDGQAAGACGLHAEALQIADSLQDVRLRAEVHHQLAMDALAAGDHADVPDHVAAAARLYRDIDFHDGLARSVMAASWLALSNGDPHLAARLLGTAAAVRDAIALQAWPLAVPDPPPMRSAMPSRS